MKALKAGGLGEAIESHKSWSNLQEYVAHSDQRIPPQTHTLWSTAENTYALALRHRSSSVAPEGAPIYSYGSVYHAGYTWSVYTYGWLHMK